jgi:transcriptional regulator with PAS, ATPase and Fis domain
MAEENGFLRTLIALCDDLAWGRPADEDLLFALTNPGEGPEEFVRLAEAFGMMLVKVEGREFHREQLIADLQARNEELEAAKALLARRNIHLMSAVQETYQSNRIVGRCDAMRRVIALALSIARRPINTLILGPTGAGKEIIAKMIHFNSPRREGPFVPVNCTAIPEALFESEMFGIEKGAATGVVFRKGLVEEASGGTLFLDELADMSLPHQAKLLRVLEEQEVQRVGRNKPVSVDIKVIAATNVSLSEAVRAGRFREDLYYRINVAEIRLPPLRERGDDILLLTQLFLERHCAQMGRPRLTISSEVKDVLLRYAWPGNVRELNNEMERAAALTASDRVEVSDLSPRLLRIGQEPEPEQSDLPESSADMSAAGVGAPEADLNLEHMESRLMDMALERCAGNKTRAAELLGITREGLRRKLLRRAQKE